MSPILCILDFEIRIQWKHLQKFASHRATENRRHQSKVFCMF